MKAFISVFLLALGVAIEAAELPVPPDFKARMAGNYGGSNLRESLVNAGVPLKPEDSIEASHTKLTFSTGPVATDFIHALVAELSAGTPGVRDAAEVKAAITGKVCTLSQIAIDGHALPARLEFLPDFEGLELDPPSWREAKRFRWGVNRTGRVEVRDMDGSLLFVGRVSAVGHLMISSPTKTTEVTVPFDERDTAKK